MVPLAPRRSSLHPPQSALRSNVPARSRRDLARKSVHDPLTAINSQLASRDARASPATARSRLRPPPGPAGSRPYASRNGDDRGGSGAASASAERTSRESAERLRALELVRRRKREKEEGGETPSTVHGAQDYGYGDVFNRREVEEAHRGKARRGSGWRDEDRDRGRDRERYGARGRW